MQEEYYDQIGIPAWEQVPFYHTSNPFIAETYAELIIAFLLDFKPHLKPEEPLYIIELATGTGCFSFHLLKNLMAKREYFNELQGLSLRYVMTDFTETTVKFWEGHPRLRDFAEMGVLDYAVFRPESDEQLFLRRARQSLSAGAFKNPLIVIANYFFDSIRQDLFRIHEGKLQEVRLSFFRQRLGDSAGRVTLEQLMRWETFADINGSYYADARWNALLDYYREHLPDAGILLPIGALDSIRNLQRLSNNNLALISSDKGTTTLDGLAAQGGHPYALHGSFSFNVNYHAIGKYFEQQGGTTFFTTNETHSITTTMNVLTAPSCRLDHSRYYFQEKVKKQNLINHIYECQFLLSEQSNEKPVDQLRSCMALLRLSNFDPTTLVLCEEIICRGISDRDSDQEASLAEILNKVRENIYITERKYNVYYTLGRIYYELNLLDKSLEAFHQSNDLFGPYDDTLFYIAACHEVKEDYQNALEYYQRALTLDARSKLTRAGVKRMKAKLAEIARG